MNIDVHGIVRFISEEQPLESDRASHQFRIIVIETIEGPYIAVHVWDEKLPKIKGVKLRDMVDLPCRLESHKNRKNPKLWFHKILLR